MTNSPLILSCSTMAFSKWEFLHSWLAFDGRMLTLPFWPAEDTTTSEYLGGASFKDGAREESVLELSYRWASSRSDAWFPWLPLCGRFWRLHVSTAMQQQDAMQMMRMAKIVTIAPMTEALSLKILSILFSEIGKDFYHYSLKISSIFTSRKRSLGQGNIFTGLCLSGGGVADTPWAPQRDDHWSGRYASYWNAFFYLWCWLRNTRSDAMGNRLQRTKCNVTSLTWSDGECDCSGFHESRTPDMATVPSLPHVSHAWNGQCRTLWTLVSSMHYNNGNIFIVFQNLKRKYYSKYIRIFLLLKRINLFKISTKKRNGIQNCRKW